MTKPQLNKTRGLTQALGQAVLSLGTAAPLMRESARNVPTMRSTMRREKQLDAAFDRHINDIKPGAKVFYRPYNNPPDGETFADRIVEVAKRA